MQRTLVAALSALALIAFAGAAHASGGRQYDVTITNISKGQTFTPILVATHRHGPVLFELGTPSSLPLEILAEDGDTGPLTGALLALDRKVSDVRTAPGLLGPGQSVTVRVVARRNHRQLSVAAMLIPTNDTFFALNGVQLPKWDDHEFRAIAYDAGTEANDQSCANIPGPRCGGEGHSPGPNTGDEGFVFVGNGFHDLGDEDADGAEVLGPAEFDWRNPVAEIHVRRIR